MVSLRAYEADDRLCCVKLLKEYIDRTSNIRLGEDRVFISFVKPHKAVHVDTIRRWITTIMALAGIDTNMYKPHSTRAAATSKANSKNVPIEHILQAAMWKSGSTFGRFYNKPISNQPGTSGVEFQNAIIKI